MDVIEIAARWDAESQRWWAESADVPGLVSEAPALEDLIARIKAVLPELLVENGQHALLSLPLKLTAERLEPV